MSRICLIVLFLLLQSTLSTAQTGYKDIDAEKYSRSALINIDSDTKTSVYYKDTSICKIRREFIGGTFSSTTIYYLKNGKLAESVYVSLRKPNVYFEEHLYFSNGKLVKWITSDKKKGVPGSKAFTDKENLALHFFETELNEVKDNTKK